jgi:hypothetical protein
MKKIHNERNAGRKPKFECKVKLKMIPLDIEEKVNELSKPYLTKKQ